MRITASIVVLLFFVGVFQVRMASSAAEPVDYLRDVKPVLTNHCYKCHGGEKQRAGLRLDTGKFALEGGNTGPAIVPGKSDQSLLIQAVIGAKDVKVMPPKEPRLTAKEIALLKAWIDQGAKSPADEKPQGGNILARHWSFQPIKRLEPPEVKTPGWALNPIDHFILARLEKEGIKPAPEADRITLIRRVSLDLTGLPPTPAEVDAFLNDKEPGAYERVVERLLASPHYGERWGRHWLDLARYADSNGFTIDGARAVWKYRDWVIESLNKDKPFDQFTIEQLAGDLLPKPTPDQLVATGFHRNTLRNEEGGIDVEQFRVESVVDRVNTTGTVFLGLTVGCCQCHDHKFDPLAQREYYGFFAFFNNCDEPILELPTPEQLEQRKNLQAKLAGLTRLQKMLDTTSQEKEEEWEKYLALHPRVREALPDFVQHALDVPENGRTRKQKQVVSDAFRAIDQMRHVAAAVGEAGLLASSTHTNALLTRLTIDQQVAEIKKNEPQIATTLIMRERPKPRETFVMIQGDFTRKGVTVGPGVPAVLPALDKKENLNRLDLARWLVDPQHPLTARVTMNRLWQGYFGLGIVETENDFGTQGLPPTHPELLDWLASELIARKWSLKQMHKLIATSATYRQSSRHRPELDGVDARNRLLARQNRIRLEAEIVRDVSLAAAGLLHAKIGGPSVFPPQPDGVYRFTQVNKNWKPDVGPDRYRRGMYTYFWRSAPHPSLTVFDAPDANVACSRRNRSNTPLQALTMLNDEAFLEFAQGLAARLQSDKKTSDVERVRTAFKLLLSRTPSPREEERVLALLKQQRQSFEAAPKEAADLVPKEHAGKHNAVEFAAWTMVSRVLLNLDEFITRE